MRRCRCLFVFLCIRDVHRTVDSSFFGSSSDLSSSVVLAPNWRRTTKWNSSLIFDFDWFLLFVLMLLVSPSELEVFISFVASVQKIAFVNCCSPFNVDFSFGVKAYDDFAISQIHKNQNFVNRKSIQHIMIYEKWLCLPCSPDSKLSLLSLIFPIILLLCSAWVKFYITAIPCNSCNDCRPSTIHIN